MIRIIYSINRYGTYEVTTQVIRLRTVVVKEVGTRNFFYTDRHHVVSLSQWVLHFLLFSVRYKLKYFRVRLFSLFKRSTKI